MKKEIFVLGDIEMGAGNLTDDFIDDKLLSKLFLSFAKKKGPCELVLNGDTFDFLKAPLIEKGKEYYPIHITSDISVKKLRHMRKAHKLVFDAMSKFIQKKQNTLYILLGNHDPDIQFPKVQQEIKKMLKPKGKIIFSRTYEKHGIRMEHGNEFDIVNKMAHLAPFTMYKKKRILNLPWVSVGAIKMLQVKKEHPFLERIKPVPLIIQYQKTLKKKISATTLKFLLKSIFLVPFYWFDPIHRFPLEQAKTFLHRIINGNYQVLVIINNIKKQFGFSDKAKIKLVVLGHEHIKKQTTMAGITLIHADTWRDEYKLDRRTRKVKPKKKYYVHIKVDKKDLSWKIVNVPQKKRKPWNFDDIKKDELKFVKLSKQLANKE